MTDAARDGAARNTVATIVALVRDLRAAGVDASLAEALDAIRALTHLDLADRPVLRAGLQAALVKRPEDVDVFAVLFDRHFPLTSAAVADRRLAERAAATAATDADADTDADETRAGAASPAGPGAAAESAATGDDVDRDDVSTTLLESLIAALRAGDTDALRRLAADAVDAYGGLDTTTGGERYVLYRVMRALDLSNLLVAVMSRQRAENPDEDAFARRLVRDDVRVQLEHYRRLLAAEVRSRLPAAGDRPGRGLVAPRRPQDIELTRASATELRELRAAVRPLARKLASRIGQRRRHRRGRLDVRRTLRRSIDAGGTPLEPRFRHRRPSRPRLVVLCDISGSVAEFARFTLLLLHALQAELAGLRSFVFVDGIAEVTALLDRAEAVLDPRLLVTLPGVVAGDGHSDYERALHTFMTHHADCLGPGTTLLVTGDARTNYRPSGIATLRELRRRCRRLYWLNPEPEKEWNEHDSVLAVYGEVCDGVFEVRNLAQLADAVAAIV